MPPVPTIASLGSTLPSVKLPTIVLIIQAIGDGQTASAACKENGTTLAAFRHALTIEPELVALYNEAIDVGNDALAEMLIDIDKVHSSPAMAGVISKNIQWLLERRKPDKYGQRVQVSMDNNATRMLLEALDKSISRIPLPPQGTSPALAARVVDVEIVEMKKGPTFPPAPITSAVVSKPTPPLTREELAALGLA